MTNRTCRIANATRSLLQELARANLAGLGEILRWNVSQHIHLFRVSSGIIPLASHPKAQWPWCDRLKEDISRIGSFAKRNKLRLSMHPGQYTVLNSPNKKIVNAAVAELSYHTSFLDALGLNSEHKIVLHVGGVYRDDREAALQRFRENFCSLPASVKTRLVLENDERNYNASEVLSLCQSLRIPMVFDQLHHQAHESNPSTGRIVNRVFSTWSNRDGRPKLHYSTQKEFARRGAHADTINASEFIKFLNALPTRDVDIMLEAKSKEKALLELRQNLLTRQSVKQFVI